MNKQLTLGNGTKRRHTAEQQAIAKVLAEDENFATTLLKLQKMEKRAKAQLQRLKNDRKPVADLFGTTHSAPVIQATQPDLFSNLFSQPV